MRKMQVAGEDLSKTEKVCARDQRNEECMVREGEWRLGFKGVPFAPRIILHPMTAAAFIERQSQHRHGWIMSTTLLARASCTMLSYYARKTVAFSPDSTI